MYKAGLGGSGLLAGVVLAFVLMGTGTGELVGAQNRDGKKKAENKPFIKHVVQDIEGWKVHVDEALLKKENEAIGKTGLKILANKLYRISLVLPAEHVAKMRKVKIFVDHQHELTPMQYHPGAGWLKSHGYDPQMVKSVHIPKLDRFIGLEKTQSQPWVILHELAHAYHDQILSFDAPEIVAAYDSASEAGIYDEVLLYTGRKVRHYGLSNLTRMINRY